MLASYRILMSRIFIFLILVVMIFSSTSIFYSKFKLLPPIYMLVGVIFVGVGAIGRIWCGVYISGFKNNHVITKGPYSMCRNPLYFFSFIGMIGLGLLSTSLLITMLLVFAFAVYYPFVIFNEEEKMKKLFEDVYIQYNRITPRFLPNISLLNEPDDYDIKPIKFKKALMDVIWFIWAIGVMIFLNEIKVLGFIPTYFNIF